MNHDLDSLPSSWCSISSDEFISKGTRVFSERRETWSAHDKQFRVTIIQIVLDYDPRVWVEQGSIGFSVYRSSDPKMYLGPRLVEGDQMGFNVLRARMAALAETDCSFDAGVCFVLKVPGRTHYGVMRDSPLCPVTLGNIQVSIPVLNFQRELWKDRDRVSV